MRTLLRHMLLLCLLSACMFAAAAADVAALVKQKYAAISQASADFDLEIWWAVREKTEKKSGTFAFAQGAKFRVVLPGAEYVSDGTKLWSWNKAAKQVLIDPAASMSPASLPSTIIRQCLSYDYVQKGAAGPAVELSARLPADGKSCLVAVSLRADAKDGTVRAIVTQDKSGNRSTYTLRKFATGNKARLPSFAFVMPKGVTVVDNTQ